MPNTTSAEGLMELAARCEAAEGPDRELECRIWLSQSAIPFDMARQAVPDLGQWMAPNFTASIDAALTLLPEGMGLNLSRYWIARVEGPVWSAEIATGGLPDTPRQVFDCYDTPTPALALCAAALRARASVQQP